MKLIIQGQEQYPIKINKYHRNFMKVHTYAGAVNFELEIDNELEKNIQFLQALYGQSKQIEQIQVFSDKDMLIAFLVFENGYISNLTDSINEKGKRTVLFTITFESLNPMIFS